MVDEVVLGNVMVDCDDERKLQRFYGELLGWEMCELFARPAVSSSSGIVFLFIEEKDYVPPVWPEDTGKQQKQMHFDFQVDNVAEMVKKAESLMVGFNDIRSFPMDFQSSRHRRYGNIICCFCKHHK